ncbi:MAG: hypothetical protein K2L08_03325 [Erysipelotrichaceae bacterium]|nr:hypothetical protein [Erysipelotrichaceae bacterium]
MRKKTEVFQTKAIAWDTIGIVFAMHKRSLLGGYPKLGLKMIKAMRQVFSIHVQLASFITFVWAKYAYTKLSLFIFVVPIHL